MAAIDPSEAGVAHMHEAERPDEVGVAGVGEESDAERGRAADGPIEIGGEAIAEMEAPAEFKEGVGEAGVRVPVAGHNEEAAGVEGFDGGKVHVSAFVIGVVTFDHELGGEVAPSPFGFGFGVLGVEVAAAPGIGATEDFDGPDSTRADVEKAVGLW